MKNDEKQSSIAGSFVWKFSERLVSQGVSFLVSLVLARLLSPNDYGIIAIVMVFINLSSVFIVSGFTTALIQKKDAEHLDFSTIFYCSVASSIIIYSCIFIVSPYVSIFYKIPILEPVLKILGLQIPLGVYNAVQNAYVARYMMFRCLFFSTSFSAIVSGTVGVGMAMMNFGVWSLVFQTLAFTCCSTLLLAFIIPWHPKWEFSIESAKSMLKYSSRILVADLSGTFFSEIRSLVIGRAYSSADLAYYSKGQQLPNIVTGNLSTALISVLFPAISKVQDNIDSVKELTRKSISLLSFILFPALFGLAAIMEPLVILLYSERWIECVSYAQLMCIGFSFGVIGILPLQTMKAIGRSDLVLKLEFIKKPIYLLLLYIGLRISVIAIAVVMVVYEIYGLFVHLSLVKATINYSYIEQFKDIFPSLTSAILMSFPVYFVVFCDNLVINILLKIILGIVIYLLVAVGFKMKSFYFLKDSIVKSYMR